MSDAAYTPDAASLAREIAGAFPAATVVVEPAGDQFRVAIGYAGRYGVTVIRPEYGAEGAIAMIRAVSRMPGPGADTVDRCMFIASSASHFAAELYDVATRMRAGCDKEAAEELDRAAAAVRALGTSMRVIGARAKTLTSRATLADT